VAIISNAVTIADAGAFSASLGSMTLIKTLTASNSANLSFVHGSSSVVFDSTYPIYCIMIYGLHPATDNEEFMFQGSIDGGSNYVEAAGGIQDIDMDAGTFRTYVFVYSGTITGLGASATTTNWRVRFVTKHRSTYLSLYVFIDNTQ
jgi:hypothetical protein